MMSDDNDANDANDDARDSEILKRREPAVPRGRLPGDGAVPGGVLGGR